MRLLLVAHSDAPWTPHYSRYFAARGDVVRVVTFAPAPIEGIDTVYVGARQFDKDRNKYLFFTRVPRIRRIIRDFRPDLVYAPYLASNGLSAVLAWKGPIIVAGRGGDVLNQAGWTGLKRRLHEIRTRFVCGRAVAVHNVSQELDDELIRLGIPASKLVQIPVGVNVEVFRPSPEMPRLQATRLVCVRKHEPVYDNITVIRALKQLRHEGCPFQCTFAGKGNLLEEHKAQVLAAGLGDCVTFTGDLPHEGLPDLLRQADIYISASLSDGTSSALLEAMATGLVPVVTRITANVPWIVHGRNGLLFEPGQPEDLARALAHALKDAGLRRNAFEENRARITEKGNQRRNMERLAEYFDGVVAGVRQRP
jgi:L-malate glycosyltransferase